ncbi:hypothetical protein JCM15519_19900 [Fundidesulfovibrio butyratiphilus]
MLRRLCWILMGFSLVGILCSTLVLVAGPSSEVSAWAGWSFLGMSRFQWQGLHDGLGLLLLITGGVCLTTASKIMLAPRDGEPGNAPAVLAALMIFLVFLLTAVLRLPPSSLIAGASQALKTWHAKSFGAPPLPGAADMSPRELAKRIQLDPDKAVANLVSHNVKLSTPSATLAEIAKENGLVPAAVYETLRAGKEPTLPQPVQADRQAPPQVLLPADPPPGLGRLKLSDVCEQYGLDLKTAVDHLGKSGIKASADMTLRQIAQANLMLPIEIYDGLRAAQGQNVGHAQAHVSPPAQTQAPGQSPAQAPAVQFPGQTPPQPPSPLAGQLLPPAQTPTQVPHGQAPGTQTPGVSAPGAHATGMQTPGSVPGVPSPGVSAPGQQASGVQAPDASSPSQAPGAAPANLAKLTLSAYCREHGLDNRQALDKLKAKGIVAFSDMTFREIAIENAMSPQQVMEIIAR